MICQYNNEQSYHGSFFFKTTFLSILSEIDISFKYPNYITTTTTGIKTHVNNKETLNLKVDY